MDVEIRGTVLYPIMTDRLLSTMRPLEKIAMPYSSKISSNHRVKAITKLGCDSATEVIDVSCLSQKSNPVIHYANVADFRGHLYCIDNLENDLPNTPPSYWVKITTIANDCQSTNVILMSTERGIVLKTVRVILPGEPLLMWFNETILAMMNVPFLAPLNIKGENKYVCHICNSSFEYPNPLKIHLALRCNQLDTSHLWTSLAKEFIAATNPTIAMNRFSPKIPMTFKFELSVPPEYSQKNSSSQDSTKLTKTKISTKNYSPSRTNLSTSISSNETLSTTSEPISPHNSSIEISPVRGQSYQIPVSSAFTPYVTKQTEYISHLNPIIGHNVYHVPTSLANIRNEMSTPAQMETIVSNLGKSKEGHICIYCGKVYSRKYGLKIHIRTHTGYKPLRCKFCSRPFGDPSNLNKHVRLHADGETPYKCDLCGKVLVRRRDLERHMKSRHQNNINYIASTLPKSNV